MPWMRGGAGGPWRSACACGERSITTPIGSARWRSRSTGPSRAAVLFHAARRCRCQTPCTINSVRNSSARPEIRLSARVFALVIHFWLAVAFLLMAVIVLLVGEQMRPSFRGSARQAAAPSRRSHGALAREHHDDAAREGPRHGTLQPVAGRAATGGICGGQVSGGFAANRSFGRCCWFLAALAATVLLYVGRASSS